MEFHFISHFSVPSHNPVCSLNKMHQNSVPSSSLPVLFFLLFALIIVPTTLCADDPRYSNCTATMSCGGIANFEYPFWGINRPNYCGQAGFELKCEDDVPKITMDQNTLRILDVDPQHQILKVARDDYWNGYCPTELVNTTINFTHFNYRSNIRNLTLFYGCYIPFTLTSIFIFPTNCTIKGVLMDVSYATPTTSLPGDPRPGACRGSVIVPVDEAAARDLERNPFSMNNALRGGFELQWEVADRDRCRRCTDSDGVCGYNQTTNSFVCFCRDQPSTNTTCLATQDDNNRRPVSLGIGLAIAGAAIVGIALGIGFLRFRQRRKKIADQIKSRDLPTTPSSKGPSTSTTSLSQSIPSYPTAQYDLEKGSTYFGAHVFSYEELEQATENFNPSKELGEGGFGTVYYGVLNDGRVVAVKRLYESNFKRVDQYMNEIEILTRIRHPNLVTLYGCTSRRSRELLLVYEYIPNGTVADHLHGRLSNSSMLTWPVRLGIAVEAATALAYLHATEIIHRDVKSNNILLDNFFHVKVADFGLSRLFPNDVTHVSTAPQGTPGYVDPEYYQCYQLTEKSDVYSFGVVLVELISAKQAVDTNRHRHDINLANMAVSRIQNHSLHELVDPSLGFENDHTVKRMMTAVAELAFRCLQQDRNIRPSMEEVLETLIEIQNEELGVQKADAKYIRSKAEVMDIRSDDVGLLKHISPPLSPDSETDKWMQIRSM